MPENSHRPASEVNGQRRYQFSLRAILLTVTVLALLLAIAVQFPRHSAFTVLMAGLLLLPLAVTNAIRVVVIRLGFIPDCWTWQPFGSRRLLVSGPARLFRYLGLSYADDCPPLTAASTIAAISTLVVVGLWPVIRELGLMFALASYRSDVFSLEYAGSSMTEAFTRSGYWLRLWKWELWSFSRWWLLFGGMLLLWMVVSAPFSGRPANARRTCFLARFLAFAPWLVVLEMVFLIGVWIREPNVVPEPSTGFVAGIFSWDLWHWDCWLDRGWLIRGAVPTLLVGYVFFARVIGWPRPVGLIAAVILVPIALMLSVACTVAYQNGFPWFG